MSSYPLFNRSHLSGLIALIPTERPRRNSETAKVSNLSCQRKKISAPSLGSFYAPRRVALALCTATAITRRAVKRRMKRSVLDENYNTISLEQEVLDYLLPL